MSDEKAASSVVGFTPEQFNALLSSLGTVGLKKDDLAEVMDRNAEAVRKALKPENAQHPDVSVYNPMGDRDHPRPLLMRDGKEYRAFLGPFPMERDTLTREEIDLLNRLEPGEFPITKADGLKVRATVKVSKDANGFVTDLWLLIPASGDEGRNNWPPLLSILREILGMGAPDVAALMAELARYKMAEQAVMGA